MAQTRNPEYFVFSAARSRCNNPKNPCFKNYGGRGIKFLFSSYDQFISHIGVRPSEHHSLDRINNNGNYELGNVRWVTRDIQNNNCRPRKKRTVCLRGHSLTSDNIRRNGGHRVCLICDRAKHKRYYYRNHEEVLARKREENRKYRQKYGKEIHVSNSQ